MQHPDPDDGKRPEITGAEVVDFFSGVFKRFVAGAFRPVHDPPREHFRRVAFGGAGGFFFTALKNYFGAGVSIYGILTMDGSPRKGEQLFGYVSAFLVSIGAGAVLAWLSAQRDGRLLFILGMFGVQILVTLFPGLQSKTATSLSRMIDEIQLVVPANAQTEDKCVGDTAFDRGFKAAFGVREQHDKFAVVVASGKNLDDAQAKLKALSGLDSSLKLRVGPRLCINDYYPVLATDFVSLSDAKVALDKIRKSSGVSDAFLLPGPL